jgi:hypothetical protein
MGEVNKRGENVWVVMIRYNVIQTGDPLAVVALLRVMLLRGAPPPELYARLSSDILRVVEEGSRLRARLPSYLSLRRALLEVSCPLIAPLCAIVHGFAVPTTTEELWATGLGLGSTPSHEDNI